MVSGPRACPRGERAVFDSFDPDASEVSRDPDPIVREKARTIADILIGVSSAALWFRTSILPATYAAGADLHSRRVEQSQLAMG